MALDPNFHTYLSSRHLQLGARGLQGLVRACHMRWSAYLKNEAMKRSAQRCLKEYGGPNRVVGLWQLSIDKILEESAPDALGAARQKCRRFRYGIRFDRGPRRQGRNGRFRPPVGAGEAA